VSVQQKKIPVVDQPVLLPAAFQHQRCSNRIHIGTPKGNLLKITAVLRAGLEAFGLKLRSHVFRSQFVSACARSSAFKSVVGEKLNVSAKGLWPNVTKTLLNVGQGLGLAPQGSRKERECCY
jgi:hypothetical protein